MAAIESRLPDARDDPPRPGQLEQLRDERLAGLAGAGNEAAFTLLYERHHRALLSFCRHMLGSQEEAEDVLQETFVRALRALRAGQRPDHARAWLFAIARNSSLNALAARRARPAGELEEQPDVHGLSELVESRSDLRELLGDLARLPDEQRAALVLAELGDLSHERIGEVLGVRAARVKALVYQARQTLIAEHAARSTTCEKIQSELAVSRGPELRRGHLRRHLRGCQTCQAFQHTVRSQRAALALVLPVVAGEALRGKVLGGALAAASDGAVVTGAAGGGAAAGGAGLVAKATLGKLGAGLLVAGALAGGGLAVTDGGADGSHAGRPPVTVPVVAAQASHEAPALRTAPILLPKPVPPAVPAHAVKRVERHRLLRRRAHRRLWRLLLRRQVRRAPLARRPAVGRVERRIVRRQLAQRPVVRRVLRRQRRGLR